MSARDIPPELSAALDKLAGLPDALRQTLTDHLWSTIPVTVSEQLQLNTGGNVGATFNIAPQTSGLELITGILVIVPAAGAVNLQLASDLLLPCPAGSSIWTPVRKLLGPGDLRQVTVTTNCAGMVQCWLWGEQMPTYGALAR
jgi:hypothetical protein